MKYDYRIVFQRAGWLQPQHKIFHTEDALRRHIHKLDGDDRPDLDPVVRLDVYRRPVGEWETWKP